MNRRISSQRNNQHHAAARRPRHWLAAVLIVLFATSAGPSMAAEDHLHRANSGVAQSRTLTDTRIAWPTWSAFVRAVTLRDYNTRVVLLGTGMLGVCAGVVGSFMLLRKRSLVGDVVGHAALPGITIAFLVNEILHPGEGKWLPGLLTGAALSGLAGALCATALRRYTRIKEDAALAIILSVFYGLGAALLTVIQRLPSGNSAGLKDFILGQAGAVSASDVLLIAQAALVVLVVCTLFFKEFSLLSFDVRFAATQGWPTMLLDMTLMGLVVMVSVVGMQSVGLILVVALLITPAAAARFWTDDLRWMTIIAALLGGLGALVGALASALLPRMAAGGTIVLVGSALFLASLLLGTRRGVLRRMATRWNLRRSVARHHLLRALFEIAEARLTQSGQGVNGNLAGSRCRAEDLLAYRSWTPRELARVLRRAARDDLVLFQPDGSICLTDQGAEAARRVARNHRLWELYLIHYADIAPSHVDRDADQIEHILDASMICELDALLAKQYPHMAVPPSPHELEHAALSEPAAVKEA